MAAAGFWAFLNLYSPQALLPALSRELGVGAAGISSIMTASALAIAITAPFTGTLADVLGRKRVIVSAMVAVVLPMLGAFFRLYAPENMGYLGGKPPADTNAIPARGFMLYSAVWSPHQAALSLSSLPGTN